MFLGQNVIYGLRRSIFLQYNRILKFPMSPPRSKITSRTNGVVHFLSLDVILLAVPFVCVFALAKKTIKNALFGTKPFS